MMDGVKFSDKESDEDSGSIGGFNEYGKNFTELSEASSENHKNDMTVVTSNRKKDQKLNVTW